MLRLEGRGHLAPRLDPPGASVRPAVAAGPGAGAGNVWDERCFRASVVLALLPIVVATARAVRGGWLPVGDNAYFAIRARDVLTEHHPLLGTWTSASISAGTNFNNPGPLLFDLLAVPAKLGGGAGVAVGAALLNCLAIIGIAVVARRRGGPLLGVGGMAAAAGLSWTMGSELLFDPWQPHSLLLTSLLLVFLVWSLACGDPGALPWTVAIASLVVQTHLSYAILVAALGAWGVVGLGRTLRRVHREDPDAWRRVRRRTIRAVTIAIVVVALCWAQPLAEQVGGEGAGNLTRLATNAGGSPDVIGAGLGVSLVASVVATPPFWLRPSFEQTLLPSDGTTEAVRPGVYLPELPATATAVALLELVALVLVGARLLAARRTNREAGTAAVTAAVGLLAGIVTAVSLPIGVIGIAPHQLRWLWPLAAFSTFAVVACLVTVAAARPIRSGAVVAGSCLVAVLAVATLPSYNVEAGPAGDAWAIPVVRELGERMEALEGEGPLLIDMRGIRFAEPYSGPVMAELQRRGIPFVVDDEGMVRQLGPSRRAEPGAQLLRIREGDATQRTPPGERRAVLVEGLDEDGQAELADARVAVLDHLEALGCVPLNERGQAALRRGDLAVAAGNTEALTTEPEVLLATRELDAMVEDDLLDLDVGAQVLFERYAELQRRWDYETVALFIAAPGAPVAGT